MMGWGEYILAIPIAWYGVWSAVTFVCFAVDKHAARQGKFRIPERTLHTLEFLGGWAGAFAGMLLLRHKSRKGRYIVVTVVATAVHLAAWGSLAYVARHVPRPLPRDGAVSRP